jgi:hypothetical protein
MSTEKLAAIKLRELKVQHQTLAAHYLAIEEQVTKASSDVERLRLLKEGLAEARFAGIQLHDDLDGVEGLLLEAELETASEETRRRGLAQLRSTLEHGRQRARFAHLIGCVLEEWAAKAGEDDADQGAAGREAFIERLLDALRSPAAPLVGLAPFFERHADGLAPLQEQLATFCEQELIRPVTREELRAYVRLLSADPLRPETLRAEAQALLADKLALDDYAGALTVMLNRLEEWSWPAEDRAPRPLWRWERWRAAFDAELLEMLLLQLVGWRIAIELKSALPQSPLFSCFSASGTPQTDEILRARWEEIERLFLSATPQTSQELAQLGGAEDLVYEGFRFTEEGPDASQGMLTLIAADVRLEQSAGAAVYGLRVDLADFFQSISHQVIEELLAGLGLPPRCWSFVQRFVQLPLPGGARARRGIPLGYKLSVVIADALLRVLDAQIFQATQTRAIRFVDDIYFVSAERRQVIAAWETIERFCADCGLKVNEQKSGAICVGGSVPEQLPSGPFSWGLLDLDEGGRWIPSAERLEAFVEQLRAAVNRSQSALELISQYNGYVNQIIRKLGPFAPLDGGARPHIDKVIAAVAAVHRRCPAEPGITAHLRGLLEQRFAEVLEAQPIPDALLYWPIAAGGLGLCNPLLVMVGFRHWAEIERATPSAPAGAWRDESSESAWLSFYRQLLSPRGLRRPQIPPRLEGSRAALAAGADVVSCYWDWVISSYGELLLERYGSFSLLIPQLMPMQLVVSSQKVTSTLDRELRAAPWSRTQASHPTFYDEDDIPF